MIVLTSPATPVPESADSMNRRIRRISTSSTCSAFSWVPRATVEHLLDRYGTLAGEVLDLIRADPGLAQPLADGHPYLRAEVAYAVTHENALHVEDVLVRRMRLFIESADSGTGVAAEVSTIMGRLLGWSRRKRAAETRRYLGLVAAEQTMTALGPGTVPGPMLARATAG